jgi:hypothetical protein
MTTSRKTRSVRVTETSSKAAAQKTTSMYSTKFSVFQGLRLVDYAKERLNQKSDVRAAPKRFVGFSPHHPHCLTEFSTPLSPGRLVHPGDIRLLCPNFNAESAFSSSCLQNPRLLHISRHPPHTSRPNARPRREP